MKLRTATEQQNGQDDHEQRRHLTGRRQKVKVEMVTEQHNTEDTRNEWIDERQTGL